MATGKSKHKGASRGDGEPPRKRRGGGPGGGNDGDQPPLFPEEAVPLHEVAQTRYLNYALSVITSRALPDVRDGLKPVQRRILYVMFEELRLTSDAKFRKCAKICGDTTGNYHPHSPEAVYDALCRMAQDFSLRYPLGDGWGNFGSVMGLPAAASRYPEARVTAIAEHLMNELRFETVDMRPNYDASRDKDAFSSRKFPNGMHLRLLLCPKCGLLYASPAPDGSALEIKTFDAHDGQGLSLAHTAGIRTGVITGRGSAALQNAARIRPFSRPRPAGAVRPAARPCGA